MLEVMGDGDVTVAEVEIQVGGVTFRDTGGAKKHPKDLSNTRIGETLAASRALRKVADTMERHAQFLVNIYALDDTVRRVRAAVARAADRGL